MCPINRSLLSILPAIFFILCILPPETRADEAGSITLTDYTVLNWQDPVYNQVFATYWYQSTDPLYPYQGGVRITGLEYAEEPPPYKSRSVMLYHAVFVDERATNSDWCAQLLNYISDSNMPWLTTARNSYSYKNDTYFEFWLSPGFMNQLPDGIVSWDLLGFNDFYGTSVRLDYIKSTIFITGWDEGEQGVATPEPATWVMLLLGGVPMVIMRKRSASRKFSETVSLDVR